MSATVLEIPAKSVYVGVVRLALASLARTEGLDEDRVEDLRMAVSEACANAVLANEVSGDPVTITWSADGGSIVVEISDRGGPTSEDSGEDRMELSVALLRSLVDECAFGTDAEGRRITRLTLRP
jgi:serine/threonine-protein kinase RsbW